MLYGLSVPSDEIRWEREIPEGPYGLRGEAAWTVQEQLRSAARQLLLAGALADRARAGYYGARHRAQAERSLDGVLVGPSPGGRRLTAFVPVEGGRGTMTRLHHALHAAREAVDYQRATGGMEAFDAAVAAGVSRELADALIALVGGSEGARVALAWAPAAGVPAGCAARPEPVESRRGTCRCSARRRPATPATNPPFRSGSRARWYGCGARPRAAAGTVRLRVLAGAEIPYVRAALDEEAYRVAGHAHLVGLPIRVSGRLQRRGGFRRLADAADVTPVPLDEVERDRLMKSLDDAFDPADVLPSDD